MEIELTYRDDRRDNFKRNNNNNSKRPRPVKYERTHTRSQGEEGEERPPRADRPPRQDRGDRAERGDRPERADRPPRGDRPPREFNNDRSPRQFGDRPKYNGPRKSGKSNEVPVLNEADFPSL